MADVVRLSDFRRARNRHVYFTRHELNLMLSLYSRRVINGEWKDYAIDHGKRLSAFSVFRDSCDRPIFTVFKYATGTHRNGDYVLGSSGNTLKRGQSVAEVLSDFERDLKLVSS